MPILYNIARDNGDLPLVEKHWSGRLLKTLIMKREVNKPKFDIKDLEKRVERTENNIYMAGTVTLLKD